MKKTKPYLIALLFLLGLNAFAQERSVSGKVISTEDGTPLPGVSVRVKSTNKGTTTDVNGIYKIAVSTTGATLEFSFVGFSTQEIKVGNRTIIDVPLGVNDAELGEVVVVAYGKQSKKSVTGSVATVGGESVANTPFTSVTQGLQGRVAGLMSVSSTGQPGALQQVRIRGIGSITAGANPLYVVDGIPVNSGDFSRNTTSSSTIAGINQNDIETISVLKDASATSIYGSRAANGVILITTKSGKSGKTKFKFDSEAGVNNLAIDNYAKPMNKAEYEAITREGILNAGQTDAQATTILNSYGAQSGADVDWFKEVTRQGKQQSYNLSASGGDNKTTYYLSGGYFQQQATVIGSAFNRISGKMNLKHNATEKLSLSAGVSVAGVSLNAPSQGGAFANPMLAAYFLRPMQPLYAADGSLNYSTTDFPNIYNPVALVAFDKRKLFNMNGLGNFGASYRVLPNLTLSSKFGIDYNNFEENSYQNPYFGDARTVSGRSRVDYTRLFNWVWTNLADYRYHITKDKSVYLDAKLGYESQKSALYGLTAMGEGMPASTDLQLPNVAANPKTASGFGGDYTFGSMISGLNFNFKDRYALSGSFRRDASSRFGINNRYGNFWSVGAAWNIDQEPFFKNLAATVSTLKLRTSYGVNGNADLSTLANGNYAWRATYGFGNNYNGATGSVPNSIGNADLTWEQNKPFDVGLELGLLKDRINIEVDYYNRTTSNLLLNAPLSRTTGFSSILSNVGSMENKGFEFTINARPIDRAFKWDVNFNIALNKNKIKSLYNNQDILDGSFIRRVGSDFQTFYVREWAGVNPDNGDPQWWINDKHETKTTDYNAAQRSLFASASPKGFGGLNNTFGYKGLSLDAEIYFLFGNYVRDTWARYTISDGWNPAFSKAKYQLNRWQKPGDITDVPKYVYNSTRNSQEFSTRFLYKGDYARLRNVTLGYDLPASIAKKAGLGSVKVYVRGTNLFTWVKDKRMTFDPENGVTGLNDFQIPITKTVTGGINIGF